MKSYLQRKSFLTILSIFVLIFSLTIFPQRQKDRTETKNVTRQPAANISTPSVQQRSPVNNQQPTQRQRQPEVKQVQRPVINNPTPRVEQQRQTVKTPTPKIERPIVNNPAPRVEERTKVINEPPPRYYEPKKIERITTTKIDPPAIHRKQIVDEPGSREPVIKQPVRKKQRPSPSNIQHDPPTVINQPEIIYTEPVYEPLNPPIIDCGPIIVPEFPTIIEYNPVIDYIPSPQRPINILTLKEQAIQDYYDEYYYDAIIDLNAAIAKDSLDFELYTFGEEWPGLN